MFPELEKAVAARGFELEELVTSAAEVILFGSRAVGCSDEGSDWDILLVDAVRVPAIPGFDFVKVRGQSSGGTPAWHRSELATHVARYGIWLRGERPKHWYFDHAGTVARKEHVIGVRLEALTSGWAGLSEARRRSEFAVLRRDMQRYRYLVQGAPVPARQMLDEEWGASSQSPEWLCCGTPVPLSSLRMFWGDRHEVVEHCSLS